MRKYYVGLDVHKVSIAIAVLDAHGKLVTRTVIETSTEAVRDFFNRSCRWRRESVGRDSSHFRRRQPRRLALRHCRTTGQTSGGL